MQERTNIGEVTFNNILNATHSNEGIGTYKDIFIVNTDVESHLFPNEETFRLEALVIMFCTKGAMRISCNLQDYILEAGGLFFCPPGSVVKCRGAYDACFSIVISAPDKLQHINPKLLKVIPQFINMRHYSYFKLSREDSDSLHASLKLLHNIVLSDSSSLFYDETCEAFLQAFQYKCLDVISKERVKDDVDHAAQSRKTELFHRFLELLVHNFQQERSVKFYAERLFVSPKYLGVVVKDVSGKYANKIIDDWVIAEARNLLKYTDLSIQQVSQQLNFPNQSFFGKYFKKHTGMSPLEFRRE